MPKAVIISTDGEKRVVEFEIGNSYKMLSEAVGGLIECVRLADDLDMWVNDNGLAEGLDQNPHGTRKYNDTFNAQHVIVGNIIFTGGADDEGETLGLSDTQVQALVDCREREFYTPMGFIKIDEHSL